MAGDCLFNLAFSAQWLVTASLTWPFLHNNLKCICVIIFDLVFGQIVFLCIVDTVVTFITMLHYTICWIPIYLFMKMRIQRSLVAV